MLNTTKWTALQRIGQIESGHRIEDKMHCLHLFFKINIHQSLNDVTTATVQWLKENDEYWCVP